LCRLNPILASLLAVLMTAFSGHLAVAQDGARQTYTEAMEWYREGARAGDAKAQFYLGLALEEGAQGTRDPAAARGWYKRAADGGHGLAGYKLAVMVQSGVGGPVDLHEARRLYELAAGRNVVEAKYNLAVMLRDGIGGPADLPGAARLFESAARGGVTISFLHLAVLNTRGALVNLVEAMKWALLADAVKLEGAAGYIEALSASLTAEQRETAAARASDWK
jgi:TPR repeat protein